ncbi:MAG: hypothetical protein IKL07_08690, partial [Clostridium sp.]|nr:hypothetical protein [Clostridium sp.]
MSKTISNKIRLGIRIKVLVPVLMLFLLFAFSLSLTIGNYARTKFIKQGAKEAVSVASLIGNMLDSKKVEVIRQPGENEEYYQDIYKFTEEIIGQTGAT